MQAWLVLSYNVSYGFGDGLHLKTTRFGGVLIERARENTRAKCQMTCISHWNYWSTHSELSLHSGAFSSGPLGGPEVERRGWPSADKFHNLERCCDTRFEVAVWRSSKYPGSGSPRELALDLDRMGLSVIIGSECQSLDKI